MKLKTTLLFICACTLALPAQAADTTKKFDSDKYGWSLPYIGRFHGDWSMSVGTAFWVDEFKVRSLQLRADMDLAPGLRYHKVLRSNDRIDGSGRGKSLVFAG